MITDNLKTIQSDFDDRNPILIAVSKKQPDDRIEDALNAGIRVFGENRVQEAMKRWGTRRQAHPELKLHLIGPLQSNKVKDAVALFDVIHTLDREKLATKIVQYAPQMPCFIQVNTGDESQKAGIGVHQVEDFYNYCAHDLKMTILGLMCIPPDDAPAGLHFGLLAEKAKILGLSNLSMGMSNDYEVALKYGATHIRVGSKLFGERPL